MKWMLLVLPLLTLSVVAQVSTEEAAARLKEKSAHPATALDPKQELDQLRREVAQLRTENKSLRDELAKSEKPATTQAATTQPMKLTPQKVADLIPKELKAPWNNSKFDLGKDALKKALVDRRILIRMRMNTPAGANWETTSYKWVPVRVNGEGVDFTCHFTFGHNSADIAAIQQGDWAVVEATVSSVQFNHLVRTGASDSGPGINLVLKDCVLKK